MKKILAVCLATLLAGSAFAQTVSAPLSVSGSSSSFASSGGFGFPGDSGNASLSAADIKADIMTADLNRDASATDTASGTSSRQKLTARKDPRHGISGRR